MLATRRTASVAFEVQLSSSDVGPRPSSGSDATGSPASGVRGLWLLANKAYDVCEEIPSFQIRTREEPDQFDIHITPLSIPPAPGIHPVHETWIPLSHCIFGALTGHLTCTGHPP